ncbi:Uncharacterised protein [Mycobacteroides abscessus subsp. abscessus]|nr:Uncharacterised protein [Mycobacteroides abscessus subsp. abscessus]
MARLISVRSKPGVSSKLAPTVTSEASPLNTSSASSRDWPRFQRLTRRGYPESVRLPGPKSVPTYTVSASTQLIWVLASGSSNPPATNCLVSRSNSRTTTASEPPRDRLTSARRKSGRSAAAPAHTQFSSSVAARASTSMTTSHSGSCRRYRSKVVRRQRPRELVASRQKL